MAKNPPLLSSRIRERRRKRLLRDFLLGAFLLIALGAGAAFALRLERVRIASVSVSGTRLSDPEKIRAAAMPFLQGTYLVIIPKDSSFLYQKSRIAAAIVAGFPEIESVRASLAGFDELKIAVEERQPFALWCGDSPESPASPCLFLDRSGLAFSAAPDFSSDIYFRYFGKLSQHGLPAQYLPSADFAALASLLQSAQAAFPAKKAFATADGDYEFISEKGTQLLVSRTPDMRDAAGRLGLFLGDAALGAARNEPDAFEYIDLRFGTKVYYKLRQAKSAATSTPSIL